MKKIDLDFSVTYQEPVEISLMINMDSLEDPAERVEMAHDFSIVLARVGKGSKTNKRCAEIIRLRYLCPEIFTQREIAKKMRISICRVGQLEDRAIRRFRMFGARMGLATARSQFLPISSLVPKSK